MLNATASAKRNKMEQDNQRAFGFSFFLWFVCVIVLSHAVTTNPIYVWNHNALNRFSCIFDLFNLKSHLLEWRGVCNEHCFPFESIIQMRSLSLSTNRVSYFYAQTQTVRLFNRGQSVERSSIINCYATQNLALSIGNANKQTKYKLPWCNYPEILTDDKPFYTQRVRRIVWACNKMPTCTDVHETIITINRSLWLQINVFTYSKLHWF